MFFEVNSGGILVGMAEKANAGESRMRLGKNFPGGLRMILLVWCNESLVIGGYW